MIRRFSSLLVVLFLFFSACDERIETPNLDLEQDYQPLGIGYYWIYHVDETIYFGENDSETSEYFYRDLIKSSYLNVENEVTYVIERYKSPNRISWVIELEYTLIYRDRLLLRTINNTPVLALNFPPEVGKIWNGANYQAEGDDEFEIDFIGQSSLSGYESIQAVRISQENLDDKITLRDVRYEVFGKGVGLLEKYDEVLTYCSRNDCLGNQLINGGSKTHLKLLENGK